MPSRYEVPIDPDAPNNSHAFVLKMIGSNKRVLELGAAGGHMTRVLEGRGCRVTALEYDLEAAQDLKGIAHEVVVADLNGSDWLTQVEPGYDVVLAGDVLEHLIDPRAVLRQVKTVLAPNGFVVISLPHIGHADVRLSLLQGRFDYGEWGLLDDTHLRFFTLKTIKELVGQSGFVMTELHRVRVPAFETELKVDRSAVPSVVLDAILADPEAETYQFVFTAIADDGDLRRRALAEQKLELESAVSSLRIQLLAAEAGREALLEKLGDTENEVRTAHGDLATVRGDLATVRGDLATVRGDLATVRGDLANVLATRTFRHTARARRAYERLRAAR